MDRIKYLQEKTNELIYQISLLEAEIFVLEDGIKAIDFLLKTSFRIDTNFLSNLQKSIYIDYQNGVNKSELILLNYDVSLILNGLDEKISQIYTALAHLTFLLDINPSILKDRKTFRTIKDKARKKLFKTMKKLNRLRLEYEKYTDELLSEFNPSIL